MIIAVLVGVVTLKSMFAMLTNLLVNTAPGPAAWVSELGGSLIGNAIALKVPSRTHPLATYLHRAEEET